MTNESIDLGLKVLPPVATIIVAIYVAFISRRQWLTSKEKLRLDLYNRRFDIYTRVLDFYQALSLWEDKPEQIALQLPFLKAYRESLFLFSEDSGVYAALDRFHSCAYHITQFTKLNEALQGNTQEQIKLFNKRTESLAWIVGSMDTIEKAMAPYLNFHMI